jgi:3-oxoacyl-[acyl-carrier protein] reductase
VETLTRILSHELGPLGITVNAVGPTPISTRLIRNVPQEAIDRITERLAIKRAGTLEDVWNVVEFFLRRQNGFISGQVIYLGGA